VDCPNEQTLTALAEGRLSREEAAAIERHTRTCSRCADRVSAAGRMGSGGATVTVAQPGGAQPRPRTSGSGEPAPAEGPELERGASVGRYTILGVVGRGGMGEVYAAYDPELDRKIALKLLRSRSADRRVQARLLREPKAIAKLSHANVVVVHDAGTFEDRVFVAMEFVDGQTLKDWLAETRRTRAEILQVFGSAARGLAAAHAAGLVHRDFKPHNVMVSREGGVRVMDFGLAREVGPAPEGDGDVGVGAQPASDAIPIASAVDLTLTRTGELVGTPLYMAPEQFLSARTDARTDQFSFCVALYQALYDAHPFAGASIDILVARVLAGEVQPPPAKHDVPTWLRRVLLRGLSVAPAARWPSMAALIEALEQDPARVRRRWGAAAGVALLVVVAGTTLVRGPRRAESLCRGGPARLAGLWEPQGPPGTPRPRRDALEAAFLRTGGASARETWPRVEAGLERYAASWLGMYRDACEATHARGEQSPETLDLRMACLDERRTALEALTGVLANADARAVSSAVDAVNALPPVDSCGDIKLLREPIDAPRDDATRARVADIRKRLATAKALNDTGRQPEALSQCRALVAEARALGTRSLLAEALSLLGRLQDGSNFQADAVKTLEEATWTALAVKRDDVAAESSLYLAGYVGMYLLRFDEGWRWARLTTALLDRMGPGHDLLRAWLLHDEANIKLEQNEPAAALDLFRRSLALKEKILPPDHPDIATTLASMSEALHKLGRDDEALAGVERVKEMTVRAYGPSASDLPRLLSNQGEYLVALGRPKDAAPLFEEATARWVPAGGAENATLAFPLTGLGRARLALGQSARSLEPLEHALRLREAGEANPSLVAETRFALARALWDAGAEPAKARPRARALATQARDAYAHAPDAAPAKTVDAWLAAHH
jgi:tRNA A-37 threonylcarbamoyl transferase component Bud32/tetratricopeptide (TPR) repeat protein